MKNSHIGCIIVFILAVVAFGIYSVPRLKEMEATGKRQIDSAALERAWEIADSVKRERLLEDPDYVNLLEQMGVLLDEIEELRDSIKRLKEGRDL